MFRVLVYGMLNIGCKLWNLVALGPETGETNGGAKRWWILRTQPPLTAVVWEIQEACIEWTLVIHQGSKSQPTVGITSFEWSLACTEFDSVKNWQLIHCVNLEKSCRKNLLVLVLNFRIIFIIKNLSYKKKPSQKTIKLVLKCPTRHPSLIYFQVQMYSNIVFDLLDKQDRKYSCIWSYIFESKVLRFSQI